MGHQELLNICKMFRCEVSEYKRHKGLWCVGARACGRSEGVLKVASKELEMAKEDIEELEDYCKVDENI